MLMKTEPDLEDDEEYEEQDHQRQRKRHRDSHSGESNKKLMNKDTLKNVTNAVLLTAGEPLTCKDILSRAYAHGLSFFFFFFIEKQGCC